MNLFSWKFVNISVRTRFEFLAQKMNGLRPKKPKNNEFVESVLENWALMNQITTKVDSDDKRMKINKFKLKKTVLSTVRGDQFIYIYIYIYISQV